MAGPAPDFDDMFAPDPESKVLMECLHCGSRFEERLVTWRKRDDDWFWCCPMTGCNGKGVGFDIFSVEEMAESSIGKKLKKKAS